RDWSSDVCSSDLDLFGGNEEVRDDEDRECRDGTHRLAPNPPLSSGPNTARLVISRSSVMPPVSLPCESTTATNGLWARAMSAATSSNVASDRTVTGFGTGLGMQSPTVRSPSSIQN